MPEVSAVEGRGLSGWTIYLDKAGGALGSGSELAWPNGWLAVMGVGEGTASCWESVLIRPSKREYRCKRVSLEIS